MIEARGLTKRYGPTTAVDDVSFTIQPGAVTGFLGPNGAGKSTTMRMIVGLQRPTAGQITIDGRPLAGHRAPLREVGALLDAGARHPGRSARSHLRALAATHHIPPRRVEEVLELTGIAQVAAKRVGGFSLGMGQRLGIAAALLGDPRVLILDEPVNGLDPDGVTWVRNLVRGLAAEGRTVFLSSHLMSEMALTADHLIVIGRGRIIAAGPMADIIDGVMGVTVRVRSPHAGELHGLLRTAGADVTPLQRGLLEVRGLCAEQIGDIAAARAIVLHELSTQRATLEETYLNLTAEATQFRSQPEPEASLV